MTSAASLVRSLSRSLPNGPGHQPFRPLIAGRPSRRRYWLPAWSELVAKAHPDRAAILGKALLRNRERRGYLVLGIPQIAHLHHPLEPRAQSPQRRGSAESRMMRDREVRHRERVG